MKEVKNMQISEGITYSGVTETDGYMDVPHGMGIMKYQDHNESGMFQDGELNGIAYLNYHESTTKPLNVILAYASPLVTELSDKLRQKRPNLPTTSPCLTMRLEAIRSIIPISCRRHPKSV